MAKAGKQGWDRCFHGTIRRERDVDGNPVLRGKIKVLDGFVMAQASNQDVLGSPSLTQSTGYYLIHVTRRLMLRLILLLIVLLSFIHYMLV
jgi:hypothetical protein